MRARTYLTAVAAAAAVATAAGCGGGSGSAAGTSATRTAAGATRPSPAAQKAEIAKNWEAFFSAKTPTKQKIALLQHGKLFAPVIEAQSKNPLASKVKATVTRVTLHGKKAAVVYTVDVAGIPALKNARGTAVLVGGRWKIADQSFCATLALEQISPAGCTKAKTPKKR